MRVSHSEGQLARRGDSADVGASGGKDDARVALGAGEAWRGARCGRQETLSLTCGVRWEGVLFSYDVLPSCLKIKVNK